MRIDLVPAAETIKEEIYYDKSNGFYGNIGHGNEFGRR